MTQTNILIIEDDRKLAEIYSVALQSVGFETKIVNDGRKVFEALAEQLPGIIILDLHLPHVSGLDILNQLQADERLNDTRIIVATADARAGDMLRDTADLILLKPVSIEQLISLARRLTQPE
ncbi:MAG TPA: response regulator [Anaerolineae bacterium]|jgi:two-component system cell cycle response regulator DivK